METVNTSEKLKNIQRLGLRRSRGNCQHPREPQENPEARAATLPRKLPTPWRTSRTSLQSIGLRYFRENCNCQHLIELQEPPNARAATLPRKLSTPQRTQRTPRKSGRDTPAEPVNTLENSRNSQGLGLRHSRGNCQHLGELQEPPEARAATLPRKLSTPWGTPRISRRSGSDTAAKTVNTSENFKNLQKLGR